MVFYDNMKVGPSTMLFHGYRALEMSNLGTKIRLKGGECEQCDASKLLKFHNLVVLIGIIKTKIKPSIVSFRGSRVQEIQNLGTKPG